MNNATLFALDVVAITVLVFGLYFPRHRRRDLVVAFLGVNIGVLAVAETLANSGMNAGLGLGLFGVLSIIRLRSAELDQSEIAYYFAALALGLLGGLSATPTWLAPVMMVAVVAAIYVGDHPRLFVGYRSQTMVLDRAFIDESSLRNHLEDLLGVGVHEVKVRSVDLVKNTTKVEVRFRAPDAASRELRLTSP